MINSRLVLISHSVYTFVGSKTMFPNFVSISIPDKDSYEVCFHCF
jgi:hypothetical protein